MHPALLHALHLGRHTQVQKAVTSQRLVWHACTYKLQPYMLACSDVSNM